jgi:hypothetical protein
MSTAADSAPFEDRTQDDLLDVERRLILEFSEWVPADEVCRCVADVASRFDDASIRAYVPVLVERIARDWLRNAVHEVDHQPTLHAVPIHTRE